MLRFPLLFLSLLFLPPPPSKAVRVNLPPYMRGRIHAISTTSPLAALASTHQPLIASTSTLLSVFENISLAVHRAHNANRGALPLPSPFATCNVRARKARANFMTNRGWAAPGLICVTDVFGLPDAVDVRLSHLDALVRARAQAVSDIAVQLAGLVGLTWHRAENKVAWRFDRAGLTCRVAAETAIRVGGEWYARLQITNEPSDDWLPDYARAFVGEFVRSDNGTLVSARMTLPVRGGDGEEATPNASTSIVRWRGAVRPFQMGVHNIEDHLAIRDAMSKADISVRQVQDATSASNIAILALPMVLNVVPVALVAEVSLPALIVYGFMSDVLTALPMAIKGVELMAISGQRFASVVTRMTDVSPAMESVVAEMWLAECRTVENVRPVGIVFVVVAAVMMVVGVFVDVLARRYMCCGKPIRRKKDTSVEENQALVGHDPDRDKAIVVKSEEHESYSDLSEWTTDGDDR